MLKARAITRFKDGWWLNVALSDSDCLIGLLFKVRNSLDSVQGERGTNLENDQILAV